MGITQFHLLISGQVHGVGYRISARNVAEELGLTGWVRNIANGRVEIMAEGDIELLEQLVTWAKKGPTYAQVDDIEIKQLSTIGEFKSFFIR
ncbi:MAG: acylphosphatase [Gammaproteobacteria bacterium]|nr:MAG: acylphosphatase [Gammaproteobacteria bacterium]RKZ96650.1 MAG: acylphosphatase [Gammaproteobacteria bacterium]RLA01317.1 MAG: acylphosphatase [Gammaproteobacteria bacterium]